MWNSYRSLLSVAVLLLVLAAAVSGASIYNTSPSSPASSITEATTSSCPKGQSQQKKSILDTDTFEKPLAFFREIMSSDSNEQEDSDITPQAGVLVLTIKGLVATLLSTII